MTDGRLFTGTVMAWPFHFYSSEIVLADCDFLPINEITIACVF